jgi:hypothetical protein
MYASHADRIGTGWSVLPGLGHTGASLRADLDMRSIDPRDEVALRRAPAATWRFATTTTEDPASLHVIALPFQPVTAHNGMRVAVSVDNGAPTILDFAAPEFSQRWQANVQSNTATEEVSGLKLAAGIHQVTIYALDPGVTLDRLEVDFTGAAHGYGAVPETKVKLSN